MTGVQTCALPISPVAIKAFVNNYLIFGIIGAVLSSVAFIIGLIPGRKKEF